MSRIKLYSETGTPYEVVEETRFQYLTRDGHKIFKNKLIDQFGTQWYTLDGLIMQRKILAAKQHIIRWVNHNDNSGDIMRMARSLGWRETE